MIVGRDQIVVRGSYDLCLSTFVQLEFIPTPSKQIIAVVALQDAAGVDQLVIQTEGCSYTDFCIGAAHVLPVKIAVPPHGYSKEEWDLKSLGDRATILLHEVRDRAVVDGWKIPFFELLLRALEHTSRLSVIFEVEDTKVTAVEVSFGSMGVDPENGKDLGPRVLRGSPSPCRNISHQFVPTSEGLKT